MKKKILCLLLALLVINLSIPHVAWATKSIDSGYCGAEVDGKNVQWNLDSEGTLTISGSGRIKDYSYPNTTPWYGHIENIKSVIIESGVTYIGYNVFPNCTSLESITIPKGVTSIGYNAFENCTSLKSVTIPEGVNSIIDEAFQNCTSLTSVTIPKSVNYFGGKVFYNTPWLEKKQNENPLVVVNKILIDGKKASGEVSIPENVTYIGKKAFEGCDNLTSVTIPKGVTSIGAYAFWDCSNLQSVTIPENVTKIESRAFAGCRKLTSAIIPSSVTSIGYDAFQYCTSLESVTIPAGVEVIDVGTFNGCTSLKSVTIPETVTFIGHVAFGGCTSLTSVTIPKSVTSIGIGAFERCNSLETFFYKRGLDLVNAKVPSETARIAYDVHDQQDGSRTKVKLVNTSENVTIKCDAMGERYEIIDNGTTREDKKVTITHDWDAGTFTTEPTCTKDGTKSYTCNKCGAMKEEIIKAGHKFSPEWNSDGTHHWHECSVCHEKQNVDQHTFEQKSDEGKHWEECTTCKQKQNENDHTFSQVWSSDGTHHWHECTDCGAERDKEGHKSKWEHDNDKHWKVCSICKKETDKASHSFSEVIFDPTEDKLGGTKCTCADCGYVYWKDFKRGNMATQIFMPDKEKIYLYCERNGLAAETTVDVGGKTLRVFLLDPLRVLKKNDSDVLGISVTYVKEGLARYNELMSLLDGDYPIEHINFFEVRPKVNEETKYGPLDSVYMMYEIPEGWDESDLEMILVQNGDDQEFDEEVVEMNGKKYLVMWKNHFSPYAMIDKLTDEERAALIAQQVESMGSANSSGSTDDSKYLANQVKTGDNSMSTVLMSTVILITAGLFLEVCIKRKRFCYKILTD